MYEKLPKTINTKSWGGIYTHIDSSYYLPFLWLNDSSSSVVLSSFCLYNRHDQVLFHGLNMYRHLQLQSTNKMYSYSDCHHVCLCYLSQQLRDNFDLLSSWEQVGERHTRHSRHLHVVDHTHQLLQQAQREIGVFQAVDSQTTTRLFIAILWWREKGGRIDENKTATNQV